MYALGLDGRIILKWFFKELVLGRGLKFSASGQEQLFCAFDFAKENLASKNGNFLTSWQPVSFSRRNMLNGNIYLEERDIAVDTTVGESETLCVLQVDQVCFKEMVLRIALNISGRNFDGHP